MIIGHGDIGQALKPVDRENFIFFASGVSNSQEKAESAYNREMSLLEEQDKIKHLVYFSSLAVFYEQTRYVQHKIEMEELVKRRFASYTIVRLGNIAWGKNPHTLINYLRNRAKQGLQLKILPVYRYIVEKEEFLHWMKMIPDWSCEMNIPGRRLKVADIVKE